MKHLNLGCGSRFHPEWTNVDFVSTGPGVIAHNLRKGIPLADGIFDVVYHSHVLEHFPRPGAERLTSECYRVLKPRGIIRVVVPDLEDIVEQYVKWRDMALQGAPTADANYDWIMLELLDQCVRHRHGGQMGRYITQPDIPNEDYARQRLGTFYDSIRQHSQQVPSWASLKRKVCRFSIGSRLWNALRRLRSALQNSAYMIGRMRLSGEVHLWMYDRYSLARLLTECGFKSPRVCGPAESQIAGWRAFCLDTESDGRVYKPHSLYMEAQKGED